MKTTAPIIAAIAICLSACGGDSPTDSTNNNVNLIANSSFETASNLPDYSNWTGSAFLQDSLENKIAPLVQDAPSDGGKWCVQLEPYWLPTEGYTETIVTGQTDGTHIYKLTAWMKTIGWYGKMSLKQYRDGLVVRSKHIVDTSSVWKQESFVDTVTVLSTDTLKIHLSAGATEVRSGKVRFDNVKFEKINK